MDVAKVDRDVAYIAMVIHACCKSLFQMFHLFLRCMLQVFYLDVAYVSRICYKCFYLDVAYACNDFQVFLSVLQVLQTYVASVSHVCYKCFSFFGCLLQVFRLDVAKVNQMLHML
jgi:hypothetical protein